MSTEPIDREPGPNTAVLSEESKKRGGGFYRPELDALRFFAFIVVFVSHVTPKGSNGPSWYQSILKVPYSVAVILANISHACQFGVYLFFLLSAYLITVLLIREKTSYGKLHVKQFYIRRALRIWPLYVFALLVGCVYYVLTKGKVDWSILPWYFVFLGNWPWAAGHSLAFALDHLWSVNVEEQFYLLWPPVVSKLGLKGLKVASYVTMALAFVAIPIGFALGWKGGDFVAFNSFTAFSSMGVGIYLATVTGGERPKFSTRIPRWCGWLVGLGCWYAAAPLFTGDSWPATLAGLALLNLGSLAILLAVLDIKPVAWMVKLGKVSYGLYVYHQIVIAVFEDYIGRKHLSIKMYLISIVLELIVTILLALASYSLLETPFLRLKERFTFVKSRPV
jgi:peptidoglycan/LPS O-acetylase OafA/YrhL